MLLESQGPGGGQVPLLKHHHRGVPHGGLGEILAVHYCGEWFLAELAILAVVQVHPWFPEGLEYERLEHWQSGQLEKLLVGMVQVGLLHETTAMSLGAAAAAAVCRSRVTTVPCRKCSSLHFLILPGVLFFCTGPQGAEAAQSLGHSKCAE